jgi:hypothetical protein
MVMNITVSEEMSVSLPVIEDSENSHGKYVVAPGENFAGLIKAGQKCSVVSGFSPALACVKQGTIRRIDRTNGQVVIQLKEA